jgi:hypothetical protein
MILAESGPSRFDIKGKDPRVKEKSDLLKGVKLFGNVCVSPNVEEMETLRTLLENHPQKETITIVMVPFALAPIKKSGDFPLDFESLKKLANNLLG